MRLLIATFELTAYLLLAICESVFWLFTTVIGGAVMVSDFVKSRRAIVNGALKCPRGHNIDVHGEDVTYTCGACGFTFAAGQNGPWICKNVECRAATPYINCHCGLSVRAPYRVGRP